MCALISKAIKNTVAAGLVLAATCGAALAGGAPARVVSMNLCTDQLAMLLAAPEQLVSVSRIALDRHVSAMADQAASHKINAGRAEEIHVMQPDLVLAGAYSSRDTVDLLRRLGVEVVQFDIVQSLDDVRGALGKMGRVLGREDAARDMIAQFDTRLSSFKADAALQGQAPRAALYYANGYTSGDQSLAGEILAAAGLRNAPAEAGYGWGKLPLEMLALIDPDMMITANRYAGGSRAEEIMDHPVVSALRGRATAAALTDHDWVCGTPHVLRAIADMSLARQSAQMHK